MALESAKNRKLPTVQALRGVAAILVVLDHFSRIFQDDGPKASWIYQSGLGNLGVSGVDIFFVISGFIMVYTTRKKGGLKQAVMFVRNRISRIYPLYWVWTTVLLVLWLTIFSRLGGFSSRQHYSSWHIISSYLLIPSSNGESFHPLLAQGWTLSFEMFFYLVFSCSIALRLTSRKLMFLAAAFAALAAVGSLLGADSGLRYLFTNSIIMEFLYGVLAAELIERFGPRLAQAHSSRLLSISLMGLGGGALLCTIALHVSDSSRFIFYGIPALSIVFGAALAGTRPAPRLLAYLGDSSYSIYLVHGFFAMVYASTLKHFPRLNAIPSDLAILIACGFTIAFSSFTYSLVERPLTSLLSRKDHTFADVKTAATNPRSPDKASRQIV